jgi:hypothetical protein
MRCITREEGCDLLTEIHGGQCGSHSSSCMLRSRMQLSW